MQIDKFDQRVLAKDGKMKRILAIDGGGMRAVLTAQMLKKIESIVREKTGNPDAVLRDHFHLVGGTSTGSMVSALVALGLSATDIEENYLEIGRAVFKKSPLRFGIFRSKFPTEAIEDGLKKVLGENITLEDVARMGIGYTAVTKRLDTGSVWPIDNNPRGKYFGDDSVTDYIPNKDYKLWKAVRASAAAPGAFSPENIDVAADQKGLFLDGGVSPHNYPAFLLFMQATIEGYGYNWECGPDKISVLSVGTGQWTRTIDQKDISLVQRFLPTMATGGLALVSLMNDCRELNELVMQWLGKPTRQMDDIDSLVGNLANECLNNTPLFSYTRYNLRIEKEWLKQEFGKTYTDKQIKRLRNYKDLPMIEEWQELGQLYADKYIKADEIL